MDGRWFYVFLWSIIAFSDKGLERKEKTNVLVFPGKTKSINGNYSLSHLNDELRYKREFGHVNIGIK